MNRLYYTIAGHLLAIETPSPEDTAKLLPNFTPFQLRFRSLTLLHPINQPLDDFQRK